MKVRISMLLAVLAFASCKTPEAVLIIMNSDEVDMGYGNVSKESVTTSVSDVKVGSQEGTTYSNMYEYLRGRVAGVEVRGSKILIRGTGSINSSTDPLILLDGVAIEDLSIVNPAEVESVEVLKDTSASIYGVRGANGVIQIKTKKPK